MEKINALIEKRWSPRAFDEKPVPAQILKRVFEAARRAPSANNEQPWRFLLGIKGQNGAYDKLFSSLNEFNQKWAVHAPVVVVVLAKTESEKNGKFNTHAVYDCGQAVAYLTFQATEEGLYIHQMAGFFPDKVKELFSLPEGYLPVTAFVLGYLGKPDILPENYRNMEYKKDIRKPLDELVFTSWSEPAGL